MKTFLQALLALTLPGFLVTILLEESAPPRTLGTEPRPDASVQKPRDDDRKRALTPVRPPRPKPEAVRARNPAEPAPAKSADGGEPALAPRRRTSSDRFAAWEHGSRKDPADGGRSVWIVNESAPFATGADGEESALLGIGCFIGNPAIWLDVGSRIEASGTGTHRILIRFDQSNPLAWEAHRSDSMNAFTFDAPIALLRKMIASETAAVQFSRSLGDSQEAEFDLSRLRGEIRPVEESCSSS